MIRALARLLSYVVRVRRSLLIGLGCILAAAALSPISPRILERVIDGLPSGVDRIDPAAYAATILGLSVAEGAFRYLMRTYLIGASRRIEYDLSGDFFGHIAPAAAELLLATRQAT